MYDFKLRYIRTQIADVLLYVFNTLNVIALFAFDAKNAMVLFYACMSCFQKLKYCSARVPYQRNALTTLFCMMTKICFSHCKNLFIWENLLVFI